VRATLRVLADDERAEVHERTLGVLARTGMRVDTLQGRRLLADAGAQVDEASRMVRFPGELVEQCLKLAPHEFHLGGRRADFAAAMNAGQCTLLADGGATQVCDGPGGARRQPTRQDWLDSTRLLDVIDEVGLYWQMVEYPRPEGGVGWVEHWSELFRLYGKHVQDSLPDASAAVWLREVLDVVFGGAEAVRQRRPFSFLITPTSPLVIEGEHTDAWLALRDSNCADEKGPALGACLAREPRARIAFLAGAPEAGPGAPGRLAPIFRLQKGGKGRTDVDVQLLKFVDAATPAERAFNAAVDHLTNDLENPGQDDPLAQPVVVAIDLPARKLLFQMHRQPVPAAAEATRKSESVIRVFMVVIRLRVFRSKRLTAGNAHLARSGFQAISGPGGRGQYISALDCSWTRK